MRCFTASPLHRFTDADPKLSAIVLATPDGFEIATRQNHARPRPAQLAAMAASLTAVARAAGREVGHDGCDRLILESGNGKLLIRPIGADLLLCMVLLPSMLLGSALWMADEIGKAIESL